MKRGVAEEVQGGSGGGAGDNGFSFAVISPTYTYKPLSELAKYQTYVLP